MVAGVARFPGLLNEFMHHDGCIALFWDTILVKMIEQLQNIVQRYYNNC